MPHTPPSLSEFNAQVTSLVNQFGAAAFCAPTGKQPDYTLFVEDDQVIAESRGAPRHPYGVYCEVGAGLSESQMADKLSSWLTTGQAYQQFLGMNVCRYNC